MRKSLISIFLLLSIAAAVASNLREEGNERFLVEDSREPITNIPSDFSQSHGGSDAERIPPSDPAFWFYLCCAFGLCCMAGMMSGLTVGYLSIDQLELEIKMRNGTDEEKRHASIIMPILSKHHLLLSTLLVANAFAMETLPICLDKIVPSYMAVIISTIGVVTFGEIIPQAICTGPKQIEIASWLAPTVKLLILALYPICYPTSKALDYFLGTHGKTRFMKKDLKTLIELHQIDKNEAPEHEHDGHHDTDKYTQLTAEETKVINSTIDLRDTPVTKEMETIDKVFMLSNQAKIDNDMIKRIARSGFSKIPVYRGSKNEVIGILKAKTLIDYQEKYLNKTISEAGIPLTPPLIVASDTSMLEMLMLFQEKRTATALISEQKIKDKADSGLFSRRNLILEKESQKLVGLISLKDIFEEILESKMADDDVHGPVTLFSGPGGQKRKLKPQTSVNLEDAEAFEKPEKGLSQPFLKK